MTTKSWFWCEAEPTRTCSTSSSAVAQTLASEDLPVVLVDACFAGLGLLGTGEIEVVLPLSSSGQRLKGRIEFRVLVETILELFDKDKRLFGF